MSFRSTTSYICDTCKRSIKLPKNIYGLDVIQRCVITDNCVGKLTPILNQAEAIKVPFIPESVSNLRDWFQRNQIYNHSQLISSTNWIIKHNLQSFPYVQVVIKQPDQQGNVIDVELPPDEYNVTMIDLNNLQITFPEPQFGIAQCVSTASQNLINPVIPQTTTASDVMLTGNSFLTIATIDPTPVLSFIISYISTTQTYDVNYVNVDNQPSINSAWVGSSKVFIEGKVFNVRSFNVTRQPLSSNFFLQQLITNGSRLIFTDFSIEPKQNYILLSNSPYSAVDKVVDKVVDISLFSRVNPQIYYNAGEIFVEPPLIKNIYPSVFIIE